MAAGKFFKWLKNAATKVKDTVVKGATKVKEFFQSGKAQDIYNKVKAGVDTATKVVDMLPGGNKYTDGLKKGAEWAKGAMDKGQGYMDKASSFASKIPNFN